MKAREAEQDRGMKDVLITIKSSQSIEDGDGPELITAGKYRADSDGVRFFYMESELTGLSGTQTDFFVTPEEVVISRKGTVTARMIFRKGQRQHFAYETPYGTVTMGLETHKLEQTLGEHGGEMEVEYDLNLEREVLTRNKFKIKVRDIKGN